MFLSSWTLILTFTITNERRIKKLAILNQIKKVSYQNVFAVFISAYPLQSLCEGGTIRSEILGQADYSNQTPNSMERMLKQLSTYVGLGSQGESWAQLEWVMIL